MISIFGKDFPDTVINIEGNSFLKYLKYEVFSFFGKDFPDTVISIEGNSFLKYLKYEVFFLFQKRFSEYNRIKEIKRNGFSLQKGRRAFFMQKTTENTENTQKREKKKG